MHQALRVNAERDFALHALRLSHAVGLVPHCGGDVWVFEGKYRVAKLGKNIIIIIWVLESRSHVAENGSPSKYFGVLRNWGRAVGCREGSLYLIGPIVSSQYQRMSTG